MGEDAQNCSDMAAGSRQNWKLSHFLKERNFLPPGRASRVTIFYCIFVSKFFENYVALCVRPRPASWGDGGGGLALWKNPVSAATFPVSSLFILLRSLQPLKIFKTNFVKKLWWRDDRFTPFRFSSRLRSLAPTFVLCAIKIRTNLLHVQFSIFLLLLIYPFFLWKRW